MTSDNNPLIATTKRIFDDIYMVRVPEHMMRSVTYMRTYGTYVTGYPDIDNDYTNRQMTTYMSIAKMVTLYKEGATIAVVNYKDIKAIYDAIADHLAAWQYQMDHAININNPPIDDLIALDAFAETVFQYARHHYKTDMVESDFSRSLHNMLSFHQSGFLKPLEVPAADRGEDGVFHVNNDPERHLPRRNSMEDYLKIKQVIQRKRY